MNYYNMESRPSQYSKGFTLVELIVVISIVVILSTIAFVSFQNYSKNARDSNKLETMGLIKKGIELNQIDSNLAILPDDYTQVLASGSLLSYEGIVGESVSRGIKLNNIPKDPSTGENYIYSTNEYRDKIQIMGFLEGQEFTYLGINSAQASGTGTKIPRVIGDNLGIILDENYNRVTGEQVDILLNNIGATYLTYFSNTDTFTSSGKELFSKIYNRRIDLINDENLANLDDSLVGYWDMKTTVSSGEIRVLKDLSKYGNNGSCYNSGTLVSCFSQTGPTFFTNGVFFDGIDDYISVKHNSSFNFGSGFTISVDFSFDDLKSGILYGILGKGNPDLLAPNNGFIVTYDNRFAVNKYQYTCFGNSAGGHAGGGNSFFGVGYDYILSNNNFYNLTISINDNIGSLYINGNKIGVDKSFNNLALSAPSADLFIGKIKLFIDYHFKGKIKSARIYNRTLSENEIKTLYFTNK